MQETAQAFFHLDHPAEGACCPAGAVTLRGWAVGKNGRPLTDLRIRLAGTNHPVTYGFLRADLAAHFKFHRPLLPGGFEANLPLPHGRHELGFEACDISGEWRPVGTVTLEATADANREPPSPPATVVQPHDFARALQLTLRSAPPLTLRDTAANVTAEIPVPAVTRFPHLPFHGHLYQPALHARAFFGRMEITGWLFHETIAIRRVAATVDLQAWQFLEYGGALPDITTRFSQHPNAAACGLRGWVDVPTQLPNPLSLRVYAELADGSWHLCHVQRTAVTDHEREKMPFARFNPFTFAHACLELHRACHGAGLSVPLDRHLWRGLRGVYQEFQSRAPRRPANAMAASAPSRRQGLALPRSVALVTHNLGYEGAPLFLLEYARALAAEGVRLHLISTTEGPLRAAFEQLGAAVQIVDSTALSVAPDASALRTALRDLARTVDLSRADLVVANTLSAYWGVHLAHLAGRPSLFYIHESTTPTSFYLGHGSPKLLPVIEETFTLCTRVSFLTEATRRYYAPLLRRPNHEINPGWIDLQQTDRYLAAHPRAELRQRLGLNDSTRLVVNVGSVCNRKGQHIFARAVDLFCRQEPALAAPTVFLMVGGRSTLFDQTIAELLAVLDRPNLRVVAETDAPLAYYGAADLFVCSSYEESFPRVILEAMACRLPILSTDVHGIPEQIRPDREGLLVPAGNTSALGEGLSRLLHQRAWADALATQARIRVSQEFDSLHVLPRHLGLAAEVAAPSR